MRHGRTALLSFVFVMLGFGMLVQAEDAPRGAPSPGLPAGSMLSPEALLKPDGTLALDGGVRGAVDLRGWKVTLDGRRGPVLTPQPLAPESETALTWSAFAHHGLNSDVYALAVIGTDLYVGGTFTQTADGSVINLNNIAKYSGGVWSALANKGLGGASFPYVNALAVIGTELYVGGEFTQTADGSVTNLNNIAKYSGGVWSALANKGLDVHAWAFAVIGTDLYVGGEFKQTADGSVTNLNYIAKYGGGVWSALANSGLDNSVHAFAVVGTDLYVCGRFTRTADLSVTNLNLIARYSGGAWSALANGGLGGGPDPLVAALAVIGTDLYVGGRFAQTADLSVSNLNNIAKYSGGVWSALANGGLSNVVTELAVSATGDLYAGGAFTQSADGGVTNLNHIAKLTPGPTITSITSKTGKPGKPATINGSGFSATKTDNKIYFGKSKATVKRATTTKLTVTIPSKCKSGKTYAVKVKLNGQTSNTVMFKVK